MKKIVTFAVVAGAALALSACGKKEEAPAAEPTAEEMMMPAEATPAADATDEAAAAAAGQEGTGNPIGPDVAVPEAAAE